MLRLAREDPALFIQTWAPPVLIDEIQYAPELLPHIKMAVDRQPSRGAYWLTGSQPFHLMKGGSESLAGRVAVLPLLGLSRREARLQTYLQRDVRDLARVGDQTAFVRFLRAAAARTAQLLNIAELARDADVAPNTARHWLSVLEASGIAWLLPPWSSSLTQRLTKTPKL